MMQMQQTIQFSMRIIAEMRVVQHNSARLTMRKKNKGRRRRAKRRLGTISKRRRKTRRLKSMLDYFSMKEM